MFSFLARISYHRLRARFRAEARVDLGVFPGPPFRGAFLAAALSLACADAKLARGGLADCTRCPRRAACEFISTFAPPAPPGLALPPGFGDPPRPYVVKADLLAAGVLHPGETISFDVVLVGPAAERLPLALAALAATTPRGPVSAAVAAAAGDGRPHPLVLEEITCVISGQTLWRDGVITGAPAAGRLDAHAPPDVGERLRVTFRTPFIARTEIRDFASLLGFIYKRVAPLAWLYGDDCRDVPERLDKSAAAAVKMTSAARRPFRVEVQSRRNGDTVVPASRGEYSFRGEWGAWAPLLAAGELFHVGKREAQGFGWYKYGGVAAVASGEDRGRPGRK